MTHENDLIRRGDVIAILSAASRTAQKTIDAIAALPAMLATNRPPADPVTNAGCCQSVTVKPLEWEPIGNMFHAFDPLFSVMAISKNPNAYDDERAASIRSALTVTTHDPAKVQALVERVDHLLNNYLLDEHDEPELCVDDDHWSAIHDVFVALRAIKEGEA